MKRKFLALCLVLSLLPGLGLWAFSAPEATAYTIGNPYAAVDWDTWQSYKAQLHAHTNGSDGFVPLDEMIEEHYRLGYDILAITDHMMLGVPWNQIPRTVPMMRLVKYERTGLLPMTPLTDARRDEILAGVGRGGRGMLEITQGIELNGAVPTNSHLNGFFCDYGQGLIGVDGDFETPVKGVEAAGGVTFINHIGLHTGSYKSEDPPHFYDDPQYANKFASLFIQYPSCLGMGINSSDDDNTKWDRDLYDQVLQKVIPYGSTPWAFAFSDAHDRGQFDYAFTVHVMPELTAAALRQSMESGAFFAASHFASFEVGDDFRGEGELPAVQKITVDEAAGVITLAAENYDAVTWVSNGKIIATGAALDLAAHDAQVGSYVRAYLTGPGGILYVQPFTVLRPGQTLPKESVQKPVDLSVFLRFLADTVGFLSPKYTPLWLFWQLLTQFDPALDAPWLYSLFHG
ncbi:MAG: hypothetical protein LBS96_03630 [Oscillospiraceae bacterium]|nr:hypothetical protein [Oscillospiraceae bacterium]